MPSCCCWCLVLEFDWSLRLRQIEARQPCSRPKTYSSAFRLLFLIEALDEKGIIVATGSAVVTAPNDLGTNRHVVDEEVAISNTPGWQDLPAHVTHIDARHDQRVWFIVRCLPWPASAIDMTPRVVLLLLFLMGMAAAQGSAPMVPAERVPPEKVPFCGGSVNPPCTTQPRLIYSPDPKYPRKQAKVHLPGTVQLATVVGRDGLTSDIVVSSSLSPEFDQAAIDAVKKWKVSPATKDGKLAATKIMLEITFRGHPVF